MDAIQISKTVRQAIEWLVKMEIDLSPIPQIDGMYSFLYKDVLVVTKIDVPDRMLFVASPILLPAETDEMNNIIFTVAKHLAHAKLADWYAPSVMGNLSAILKLYVLPKESRTLRRYQLLQLLDGLIDVSEAFQIVVNEVASMSDECLFEQFVRLTKEA